MKQWYQSKTVWFNVLAAVVAAGETLLTTEGIGPYALPIVTIGNLLLRLLTEAPIEVPAAAAKRFGALLLATGIGGTGLLVSCTAIPPSVTFSDGKVDRIDLGVYALLDGVPSDQKHVQASTTGLNVRQLSLGVTSIDRTDNSAVAEGSKVTPIARTQTTSGTSIDYDLVMGDAFGEEVDDGTSVE